MRPLVALVVFACAVSLCTAGTAFAGKAHYITPAVVGQNTIVAPGPKPSLDLSEYEPYRGSAVGSVVTGVVAHFTDGSQLTCRAGDTLLLYPARPFVLWALRSWLQAVDGKPERYLFPESVVPMPASLGVLNRSSILPSGTCSNGRATFVDVPPGKYYLVAVIYWTTAVAGGPIGGSSDNPVMTPIGIQDYKTANGPYRAAIAHLDGYIMTGNEPFEVREGLTTVISPDSIHPAAHFLPH